MSGADEATADTESLLRSLVDAAPIPLWRAGPDGDCIHVNQCWQDFTGLPLASLVPHGWHDNVHPDDVGVMRGAYQTAFGRREPVDLEYRLRRHDGAWRALHDRRRPLWHAGTFLGVLGCCVDLTDLQHKDAECRRAMAERDMLLAELQHRVRNNAQSTASLLSLQAGRATDRSVQVALRAAAARIARATLVQQHFVVVGNDGGIDLGDVLELAVRAAVSAAANPRLALDVARESTVKLPVSRAQPLALATGELAANAALHAYPAELGGRVGFRLGRLASGEVEISIADEGVGAPSLRPAGSPTGQLGLHLAERLAKQAGATLRLRVANGTTATIRYTP